MNNPEKEFVIRHVIEDVSIIESGKYKSFSEEHFNIPWKLEYCKLDGNLSLYLECGKDPEDDSWEIHTETELKLLSENGTSSKIKEKCCFGRPIELGSGGTTRFSEWGWQNFISWKTLQNSYAVDRKVTIEAHVVIKKMIGCGREKLRNFDESNKELSDVVLIVKNTKFYVSKLFLGFQSNYFKSMFLGDSKEFRKSEVILNGVDPESFQMFLELIHGESPIDDNNVKDILHVTNIYDSQTVWKRCEEFLLEKSKKSVNFLLKIAIRYNLKMLKEKCLSNIRTINDIQKIITTDNDEMDIATAKVLLQKSISLHQ